VKVGDLVRLNRHGCEGSVGVIVERVAPHSGRLAQARVLWGTTGKVGICYVHHLEAL
jgi:hypothetical protein